MGLTCESTQNTRMKEKNWSYKSDYSKIALITHNKYRIKHNASPLELDENLNVKAEKYAKELINFPEKYLIETYHKKPLGENIYISDKNEKPKEICKMWYEESKNYNYHSKKFQKNTLHFTQLIWNDTEKFGFGYIFNESKTCAVALYYPPGNIFDKFDKNIKEPKN